MARIRTIKPEFWQHEELASCTPHARLLAIAVLQLCDCNGVFLYIPMQVHAHAFPWEATVNVPALLGELESIGYVYTYWVRGKQYGYVPGFKAHQRLTGKEAQSGGLYPLPEQEDTEGNHRGSNGEAPGKHLDAQERGTGKEEEGARSRNVFTKPSQDELIEAFTSKRVADPQGEAEKFVNYYESNGWKVGRNKMVSWKHAVANWCRNIRGQEQPEVTEVTI